MTSFLPKLEGREIMGLTALAILLFVASVLTYFHLGEDAFISYRYSRMAANGHGLVYNMGERVEGYSNLLWVVAMIPFEWLGIRMHLAARILITLLFALLAVMTYGYSRKSSQYGILAWALPIMVALDPFMHFHDDQGLETVPYVVAIGMTLLSLVYTAPLWISGLLASSIVLLRPEGIGFAWALAPMIFFLNKEKIDKALVKNALIYLAIPTAVFVAQLIFRQVYYGEWVPNTVIAKRSGGGGGAMQIVSYIATRGGLPLLSMLGIAWALTDRKHRPLAAGLACLTVAAFAFQLRAGGLLNTGFRYLAPFYIPTLFGAWFFLLKLSERIQTRPAFVYTISVVMILWVPILLVGNSTLLRGNTDAPRSRFANRWLESSTYNVAERVQWYLSDPVYINASVGQWVDENLEVDALLAGDQMGMFGFYAGRHSIIDVLGLMDRDIARRGLTIEYLKNRAPKYLIIESCADTTFWPESWRGKPIVGSVRDLMESAEFKELYAPTHFLQPNLSFAQKGFLVYTLGADPDEDLKPVTVGVDLETFEKAWRVL